MVVSIGNFTYADRGIGSTFSAYFANELQQALGACGGFEVLARDGLDEILEAAELRLSDLNDPETAGRVGNLEGIQGILAGSFTDAGETVTVFLKLVAVETGTPIAESSLELPKRLIPSSVSIVPDNYGDAVDVMDQLSAPQGSPGGNLKVRAWTRRGDGGTYFEGETLVMNLCANRDCFVKVYHIDVNKRVSLIFPNESHSDNFIAGNHLYRIPDASYGFDIVLGEPFGTEFIRVVASTTQFDEIEEPFVELGSLDRKLVKKGLSVRPREEFATEVIFCYTILSR
jgi:hypothetical protein